MKTEPKYVPVVRWKGAEIGVLRELDGSVKKKLQPLFEFVPKDFADDPLDQALTVKVREIATNWGWADAFFLDFWLLGADRTLAAIPIFDHQADEILKAILCVRLDASPACLATLRTSNLVKKHGLCIRIGADECRQVEFKQSVERILAEIGQAHDSVDIVVDFGVITERLSDIKTTIDCLSSLSSWRSITVISGSFPEDLSHLPKNNEYLIPRHDWLSWRKYSLAGGIAQYGDYTIQHGKFEEKEGKGGNFSASIRYTGPADWVIMRGESVLSKTGAGYAQYPANAMMLCGRTEFCGPDFSPGDAYIKEMSGQIGETGGPKEWLKAGISHHIAYIVFQLGRLDQTPDHDAASNEAAPDWPASKGNNEAR